MLKTNKEKIKEFVEFNYLYILLYFLSIGFSLFYYPKVRGVDAFQVIWMAQAIKEGALFSQRTWLISFFSFLGYYPFSYRAIGVPIVLCILSMLLEIVYLGMKEAILLYDIIILLVGLISSKNFAEKNFNKLWHKYLFVASILLSPYFLYHSIMTASTRIIITIAIINILSNCLTILKEEKMKYKLVINIIIWLFIGIFSHRLWILMILILLTTLFVKLALKSQKLLLYSSYSIIPLIIMLQILGCSYFSIDPRKFVSPFSQNSTLIGLYFNILIHYGTKAGLPLLFFPIGTIISYNRLIEQIKTISYQSNSKMYNNFNKQILIKRYFFLFLSLPFYFTLFNFYSEVIFLPILLVLSIMGFIEVTKYISKIGYKSKNIEIIFIILIISFSIVYTLFYVHFWFYFNYSYIYIPILITLFYVNLFFIHDKINFKSLNIKMFMSILKKTLIILSILIFTITTSYGRIRLKESSKYPWENRYLTEEEIEIIDFFKKQDIKGLIFVIPPEISIRIAAMGFLPAVRDRERGPDGKALYYGLVSPEEVRNETYFSFSQLLKFDPFVYKNTSANSDPTRHLYCTLINLNVSIDSDLETMMSLNVQYVISVNPLYYNKTDQPVQLNLPIYQPSILDMSLNKEGKFHPIFSTLHLDVWIIF